MQPRGRIPVVRRPASVIDAYRIFASPSIVCSSGTAWPGLLCAPEKRASARYPHARAPTMTYFAATHVARLKSSELTRRNSNVLEEVGAESSLRALSGCAVRRRWRGPASRCQNRSHAGFPGFAAKRVGTRKLIREFDRPRGRCEVRRLPAKVHASPSCASAFEPRHARPQSGECALRLPDGLHARRRHAEVSFRTAPAFRGR